MALKLFHGGVGSVIIDEAGGDFLTPLLTLTELPEEGQKWPQAAPRTTEIYGNQSVPVGEECDFDFFALNQDEAVIEVIRLLAFAITGVDMKIISMDGNTTLLILNVLMKITTSPIVKLGEYGIVKFAGEKTSYGTTKVYTY